MILWLHASFTRSLKARIQKFGLIVFVVFKIAAEFCIEHFESLLFLFEKRYDIHYDEALMAIFVKFVIRVKGNSLPIQEAFEILQLSKGFQNVLNLNNYSCSQKPLNDLHLRQVDESWYPMKHQMKHHSCQLSLGEHNYLHINTALGLRPDRSKHKLQINFCCLIAKHHIWLSRSKRHPPNLNNFWLYLKHIFIKLKTTTPQARINGNLCCLIYAFWPESKLIKT